MTDAPRKDPLLDPVSLIGVHFNLADKAKFKAGLAMMLESLFDGGATTFASDNLIVWNRNLSFLRDPFFVDSLKDETLTLMERGTVWRRYILTHFAEVAANLAGDYVELGCHKGISALDVVRKVDFAGLGKQYYLYDLFEWKEGDGHSHMEGHDNSRMYEDVVQKFASYPFVRVIRGSVPQSFEQGFPDSIAFAHIDMNHPVPEAAALEAVLPRMARGGFVVLDDYGWWGYSRQKQALDPIAARHGLKILELPTAQGLLVKY